MKGFNDFEVMFNTDVELKQSKGKNTTFVKMWYVVYQACLDDVAGRKTKENCRQPIFI